MRADRLLTMMLLLQTHGKMTAQTLATKLEVSRRTILRDIDALSAAGVPIYADGGHGGGIVLDEHYRTALVGLRESEIRTLFIGNNAQLLREIGLGEAAESTLFKLRAVVPSIHQSAVEHLRQRILIDAAWWWSDNQALPNWELLQQAVHEDRCIEAVYERHDGTIIERILHPYSLVAKSSIWYLVAEHNQTLHTYRVIRLRHIKLCDTYFQRRNDFDLPTYWQEQLTHFSEITSGYRFTLQMHPEQLNFVKGIAPGRYQHIEASDPNGWMTLQFEFESIHLAKMLVFGLGDQARVVEPPELHAAVQQTARALLQARKRN
jgi:predicted DNA-binding transcriptional regulator YafY